TLRRATPERDLSDPSFLSELARRIEVGPQPPTDYGAFINDPLSIWIESTFGLASEPGTGRLRRATPISLTGPEGAARRLAESTSLPEERCVAAIQEWLLAGYRVTNPETNFPAFAFRLHQFISRGDTVYATLQAPEERYVTTHGQQ